MNRGRMPNSVRDQKMAQGKDLFVKGYSIQTISDILELSLDTITKWRKDNGWDAEKELNNISPSEIRGLILKNVEAIKKGKKMPYKPDDISKLVAALDKIDDKRKEAVYTMEAFNKFSKWLLEKAVAVTGNKREEILKRVQDLRVDQDLYVNELLESQ